MERCWTASARVPDAAPFCAFVWARMCGGRSERQRLKSGAGKTVRALARMLVVVSSRVRWGLNWYLLEGAEAVSAYILLPCVVVLGNSISFVEEEQGVVFR